MTETAPRSSLEHRRSIGNADVPAFFCRFDAPHAPFVKPWMDMKTGDSFEHTELAAHPKAMENIQLRSAYASFTAARARALSVPEALATLADHVKCPLTCEGMAQPVRAPDNLLYEANKLVTSLHSWKAISPMTRAPFPEHMTLAVDRRMQQLSAACGTAISEHQRLMGHLHVSVPRFAPTLEAMEEGRTQAPPAPHRWAAIVRVTVNLCEGVATCVVLQSLGAPAPLSAMGGVLLFVGATMLPPSAPMRLWRTPHAV